MNDLYNIGYFDSDGDMYRIDFSDSSPLFNNNGSNGALFNLTNSNKSWTGAGSASSDIFSLPDLTQLSLDNFVDQAVAFLSEGYDYGLEFTGTDQNDAFYLDGFNGSVDELTSNDVNAWMNYVITEGKDIIVFPDEIHQTYNSEMAPYGVLGSWGLFDDQFWNYYNGWDELSYDPLGFSEYIGTDTADNLHGHDNTVYFGLGGADTFYSGGFENQIFVGGEGADKYKIDSPGFMTIYDGGYSGNDTVEATGIGLSYASSYVATIEGGQHLYVYDYVSDQGIVVIDYLDESSKIETIKLGDGSYSYDQVISSIYSSPNYMGDITWYEATNGLAPPDVEAEIDFYKNWHQQYAYAVENFNFEGATYKFTNASDLTVTADPQDTGVYVNTTAENVYKIFDNRYVNDTFIGHSGTQVFRSEGGFDVATGGKGFDVFRVDGSTLSHLE